jgi:hypothetical protein
MASWISVEVESIDRVTGAGWGVAGSGSAGAPAAEAGVTSKEISNVPQLDKNIVRLIKIYTSFFIHSPQTKNIRIISALSGATA